MSLLPQKERLEDESHLRMNISLFVFATLATTATSFQLIGRSYTNPSEADDDCLTTFGTHLASIHSLDEQIAAQTLCNTYEGDLTGNCWLGGVRQNPASCNWSWADDSIWDYEPQWLSGQGCEDQYMCIFDYNSNNIGLRDCSIAGNPNYPICNTPVTIINDSSTNCERIPSNENVISYIDVLDEIYIEFNIMIYSFDSQPTDWSNLIYIGDTEYASYPSIDINAKQKYLRMSFSQPGDRNQSVRSDDDSLSSNQWHNIQWFQTQEWCTVLLDDVVIYNATTPSHAVVFNQPIYACSTVTPSSCMDAIISDLIITTKNSVESNKFNYLCDGTRRISPIGGSWTLNDVACTVTQTDASYQGAVAWMGDRDLTSKHWTDYTVTVAFKIISGYDAGLLIRAQSVDTHHNAGDQFYIGMNPASNRVFVGRMNGAYTLLHWHATTIAYSTIYTMRVTISGNTQNTITVYLNDEFQFTYREDTLVLLNGSVAFRMHEAHAEFYSLEISFASDNQLITQLCPTVNHTTVPTTVPTPSPTACNHNKTQTNDGEEESIGDTVTQLQFEMPVSDPNEILMVATPAQYYSKTLRAPSQVICNGTASCSQSKIVFDSSSICNIQCGGLVSCADAEITVQHCGKTHIICNGENACHLTKVTVTSTEHLTIECGVQTSCNLMTIDILGSARSTISCIGLHACDNLMVTVEPRYYQNKILNMHSFSENITFYNGFGYEQPDGSTQYIHCNTDHRFIAWNASLPNTKDIILNEYTDDLFPCDGITVKCFDENETEFQQSQCSMKFTPQIDSAFNISGCHWIPVSDLITISCNGECESSPTYAPTASPSNAPTAFTTNPTRNPTKTPTQNPIRAPTANPTLHPTTEPTSDPTNSPTVAPTSVPTWSPSAAPTRIPTRDIDEIYDVFIEIEYGINNLTADNKQYVVANPYSVRDDIEEIIESSYFSVELLPYSDFFVDISQMNGMTELTQLTEYDLDINNIHHLPMTMRAKIETNAQIAGFIITQTYSNTFIQRTQRALQRYFNNNSALLFTVLTAEDELETQNKFESSTQEQDNTALILSIFIVSVGVCITLAAFVFNKRSDKVDNAQYLVPSLIALNLYDFLSDINLSITIIHNGIAMGDNNIIFWLGILSIFFIVIPFGSNVYYAMRITNQRAIKKNPSARAWFGKYHGSFILLSICCAGTYPVLQLTSSRLFALDFFNAGLLSSELYELSEIKIRSTVYCANVPQLMIQILYCYLILTAKQANVENAAVLAFIASLLSIIASLIVYKAQKQVTDDYIVTKYFISLYSATDIKQKYHDNIKAFGGLKKKLGAALCQVFNISHECIEIGYVTPNDHGCIIHLQHRIFKESLEDLKNKLYDLKHNTQFMGLRVQITEDTYISNLFEDRKSQILQKLLIHFEFKPDTNVAFMVSYHKKMEDVNGYNGSNCSLQSNTDKIANRMKSYVAISADDSGNVMDQFKKFHFSQLEHQRKMFETFINDTKSDETLLPIASTNTQHLTDTIEYEAQL